MTHEGTYVYPGAITEIAEVLARQQGKEEIDVWREAMVLYWVRFETRIVPQPDREENGSRR